MACGFCNDTHLSWRPSVLNKWVYRTVPVISIFFILLSNSFAAGYRGFKELKESECAVLGEQDLQKLPPQWHKYKGFVKICGMKRSKAAKPKVFIVSVWGVDYMEAEKKEMWEDFPCTIIVDGQFRLLGTFPPDLYPIDPPVDLIVYYGKWKTDIPAEIRIDVLNNALGGDYYYAPFIWSDKDGQYHMKTKESKSGKRPK